MDPLTEEELADLEHELRTTSQWALEESDVRRLQLRHRAFEELRRLRTELIERRAAELSMQQHLVNIEEQLATVRRRGRG